MIVPDCKAKEWNKSELEIRDTSDNEKMAHRFSENLRQYVEFRQIENKTKEHKDYILHLQINLIKSSPDLLAFLMRD